MMVDVRIIEALRCEWDELACIVPENPFIRPVTRVSWDRCTQWNVNPQAPEVVILSDDELALKRVESAELVGAAVPYMRHLSTLYQEVPHIVALADKDGWIVDLMGTPDELGGRAVGLCTGASWHEKYIGNNGVGTCLALGQPVLVYGEEHYTLPYHSCACIGVPIRDTSGSIIGAIDLSVPVRFAHGGNFAVLQACAVLIEKQIKHQSEPLTLPEMVNKAIKMIKKSMDRSIRDEKNKEAMLQLENMHLMGELAAGVGHEVRNPLTTVRGFLQFYKMRPEFANHSSTFDLMIEELDRASSIITEFLSLGRQREVSEYRMLDLNTTVRALSPLLSAEAIKLGCELDLILGDIPELILSESQIRQVILNLVKNGLDAMPSGGKLTISTYCADRNTVTLEIRDRGAGIPDELLPRLGTPFVTTKEHGTGLGLAICYDIISRHHGSVRVTTGPTGTCFYVDLPISVSTQMAGAEGE